MQWTCVPGCHNKPASHRRPLRHSPESTFFTSRQDWGVRMGTFPFNGHRVGRLFTFRVSSGLRFLESTSFGRRWTRGPEGREPLVPGTELAGHSSCARCAVAEVGVPSVTEGLESSEGRNPCRLPHWPASDRSPALRLPRQRASATEALGSPEGRNPCRAPALASQPPFARFAVAEATSFRNGSAGESRGVRAPLAGALGVSPRILSRPPSREGRGGAQVR